MFYVIYSCIHDNTCTCIILQYVYLLLIHYIYLFQCHVILILNYYKCLNPLNLGPNKKVIELNFSSSK